MTATAWTLVIAVRARAACLVALTLLAGCGARPAAPTDMPVAGRALPMAAATTFRVVERGGYRVVDVEGGVVSWGGASAGPRQHVRLVLLPRGADPPPLTGDLRGAMVVRTPVRRIAVNSGPHEAMLTAIGGEDRLVAVGGTFSYNPAIRARVLGKQLAQVGYGWHSPPELDVLVAAKPDIFVMALGDLEHVDHLSRIQALGIPVLPTFVDAEPGYMGKVDYVRLMGLLTGREREADAFVARVTANVARLKALAAARSPKPMIWAWHGRGDRWGALVRNAEAALAADAGGVNLLREPDDPARDALRYVGTEELLRRATHARCWIIRDDQSPPFADTRVLTRFAAAREGCLWGVTGRMDPDANAFDYYEMGTIRPDLILGDLIAMLHPELGVRGGGYILPEPEPRA